MDGRPQPHTVIGRIRVDRGLVIEDDFLTLTEFDRFEHMGIIGATGVGKSTLYKNLAQQDMRRRAADGAYEGMFVIDPTGRLAEDILDLVPRERLNHVCYINVTDRDCAVGIDLLRGHDPRTANYMAGALVTAMHDIFETSWGERLENYLRHAVVAISLAGETFIMLHHFLVDEEYRNHVLSKVGDPYVLEHFRKEVDILNDAQLVEHFSSMRNKVGQFVLVPEIRALLGQRHPKFDLEHALERGRIVVLNPGKGIIDEKAAYLLSALCLSRAKAAILSRARLPRDAYLRPFYILADESQNYATSALGSILDEARKWRVSLSLATQFTANLPGKVRAALFGNVNTLVSFRVGYDDAVEIGNQMQIRPEQLLELEVHRAYVLSHAYGRAYDTRLLPHPEREGHKEMVVAHSRKHYARPTALVEHGIRKAYGFLDQRSQPKPLAEWPRRPTVEIIKPDIRLAFCAELAKFESGDGLSASRNSDRYAPRVLAKTLTQWKIRELAGAMGEMLAVGTLKVVQQKREGRPTITRLQRNDLSLQ